MTAPIPTHCIFCGKHEVSYALYDWATHYPACGDCTAERIGQYREVVDALAVWSKEKYGSHTD